MLTLIGAIIEFVLAAVEFVLAAFEATGVFLDDAFDFPSF